MRVFNDNASVFGSCGVVSSGFEETLPKFLPRERIVLAGVSELSDSELISVIVGSGIKGKTVFELSDEVAKYLKTCQRLPKLSELCGIQGLGKAKSCQILACLELSSRFLLGGVSLSVTRPEALVPRLAFMKAMPQETVVCICLNGANRVLDIQAMTVGLANQTQVHPREAFSRAIQLGAISVIFAHNHPSGTLHPSQEDLEMTRKLVAAGAILDIPVLDHLIVSREGWASLKALHPGIFAAAC